MYIYFSVPSFFFHFHNHSLRNGYYRQTTLEIFYIRLNYSSVTCIRFKRVCFVCHVGKSVHVFISFYSCICTCNLYMSYCKIYLNMHSIKLMWTSLQFSYKGILMQEYIFFCIFLYKSYLWNITCKKSKNEWLCDSVYVLYVCQIY